MIAVVFIEKNEIGLELETFMGMFKDLDDFIKKTLEKIKNFIYQNDRLFKFLEAEICDMGEGWAEVKMTVKEKHLNAAKVCQGGVIFTLADLAFALASNSYGYLALSIKSSITFFKPAKKGDTLIAKATEINRTRKLATYHIPVHNSENKLIAFFEGTVYIIGTNFLNQI